MCVILYSGISTLIRSASVRLLPGVCLTLKVWDLVALEDDFIGVYINGWVEDSTKGKEPAAGQRKKYLSDETVEGLRITGNSNIIVTSD